MIVLFRKKIRTGKKKKIKEKNTLNANTVILLECVSRRCLGHNLTYDEDLS